MGSPAELCGRVWLEHRNGKMTTRGEGHWRDGQALAAVWHRTANQIKDSAALNHQIRSSSRWTWCCWGCTEGHRTGGSGLREPKWHLLLCNSFPLTWIEVLHSKEKYHSSLHSSPSAEYHYGASLSPLFSHVGPTNPQPPLRIPHHVCPSALRGAGPSELSAESRQMWPASAEFSTTTLSPSRRSASLSIISARTLLF